MRLLRVPIYVYLALLMLSCRKNIPGQLPFYAYDQPSFHEVFESYWTGMNTNYVWWSQDTVNWDRTYLAYRPRFDSLNVSDTADQRKSVGLFRDMTAGLIDSHYYISFTETPYVGDSQVYPAVTRKASWIRPALTDKYFMDTLTKRLDNGGYWGNQDFGIYVSPDSSTPSHLLMVTGTIGENIVYFHFNTFYVQQVHDSNYIFQIWNKFLYYLDNPPEKLEGLIFDLRSNSGGNMDDLNYVAGRLISQEIDFGYTRQKSGAGRLDYTAWAAARFVPFYTINKTYPKPIVVLTDQHSASMAELTTMALKMLPNVYVIGDTTWGATGLLNSNISAFNGGQFYFDNFGFVRTTVVQFKYHNGMIYEGKGFPPDKYVPYAQDSRLAGNDVQLSAAVTYITAHQ